MKIHLLSDLHMEFGPLQCSPKPADVVVLAGDIHKKLNGIDWAIKTFPNQPIIYVAGNHEFYGGHWLRTINKLRTRANGSNVHFLENEAVEILGVRFVGTSLWTDFELHGVEHRMRAMDEAKRKMNDYRFIRAPRIGSGLGNDFAKLLPIQTIRRFEEARGLLRGILGNPFPGPTVVVTHHAPHAKSIPGKYEGDLLSGAYASDLSALLMDGPDLWLHGHIHHSADYRVGKTRVVCNPRGYPDKAGDGDNAQFDPGLVLEIDVSGVPV